MRKATALAGLSLFALSCAHGTTIQKVGIDTYHITCPDLPLGRCLSENVNNTCDGRAYFVRGIGEVNKRGQTETPDVATSSQAFLECANGDNWGEMGKQMLAGTAASPGAAPALATPVAPAPAPPIASAPKAPEPVCKPGSTQSCVGAAACAGGQACKADGSGYEPCDCGPPKTPQ